ncbi:7-deoxyloganetin glucosyltransferase-like isoform X2 [Syzygium oleosum]|uniref:7-deoxyloganetin glucosyltransferase-like isoform X2 n=1 Tax=Syzygium oleosum TaxID=219896 RepID=UPI0024B9A59B|nr:7-deoxyloganetin glucosyltransferase-like isoform X2 [Syzygium oleosum]
MGSAGLESAPKPHAVCIPLPAQSHIGAMLKLAKLLHHKGFHISFVNTEFNHRRLARARGLEFVNGTLSDFQFLTIPDGLPPSDADAIQDIPMLCNSTRNYMIGPFSDLVSSLSSNPSVPPVTCIVSDGFMTFTTSPAASKFGIPLVHLFTVAGCALMAVKHLRALGENGLAPLTDESQLMNGYGNTPIDWIPRMKNMRLRDMPFVFQITGSDDTFFTFLANISNKIGDAMATIVHTFRALEPDVLHALSSMIPRVYTVGPLHLMIDRIAREKSFTSKHIECNLLEEHNECLEWLDSKEPKSVIYVNFGSIAFLTHQQLVEFAMGLANSYHCFLWVLRPDIVNGDKAILPGEFVEETRERGFLSGWCPQERVLNHPSIGGFLTHCGWNSTIKSLSAGIPMLCWPCFGDQQTNCKYICDDWRVGLEMDSNVKRDEVERLVRESMEGEVGKKMRSKAVEWKKMAEEAAREKLMDEVLLK